MLEVCSRTVTKVVVIAGLVGLMMVPSSSAFRYADQIDPDASDAYFEYTQAEYARRNKSSSDADDAVESELEPVASNDDDDDTWEQVAIYGGAALAVTIVGYLVYMAAQDQIHTICLQNGECIFPHFTECGFGIGVM